MKHLTPDAYATAVALDLVTKHHFPKVSAVGAVQSEEAFLRSAHSKKVPVSFAAKRLADKAKRKSKPRGRAQGSSACAPFVPPTFVTPEIADALDRASEPEGSSAGHIFGSKKTTTHYGVGIKPGVVRSKSGSSWTKNGAKYVSSSDNSKIGAVDTTWASIASTCIDCDFKTAKVCYAMGGKAQYTVYAMDKGAADANADATQTARDEADCIDSAYDGGQIPEGRILRVHSAGDTSTTEGARALAKSIDGWYRRGGAVAYTYTHAWRRVPRSAFGRLSVLASLNPGDDARIALKNGYGSVTALVTNDQWASRMVLTKSGQLVFKRLGKTILGDKGASLDFIPCPAQYPVDTAHNREAFTWKLMFLGRQIGVQEGLLERFASKIKSKTKFGADGLPTLDGFLLFEKQIDSAHIFPPVQSPAFRTIFRLVGVGEKATCDRCGLCYDDQKLGREGRAVAFRGDKSGGIVRTESLLRKKQVETIIEAAAAE